MNDLISLVNSANYIGKEHRGRVVVCGSHGGVYCAAKAIFYQVRGIILHDAGFCLDNAGVAVLDYCQPHLVPAAVVDSDTAYIGNVEHTYANGIISACNAEAVRLGVAPGMKCADAAELLVAASPKWMPVEQVAEHRHEHALEEGWEKIVCIDSATLIRPEDEGRIVVTGSHGGLIGGNPAKAINVPACFAAFNDAGFGFDNAGAGRLGPLDTRGIPAVLVAAASARIGDGQSTLFDGVISAVNRHAEDLGFKAGVPLRQALHEWQEKRRNQQA